MLKKSYNPSPVQVVLRACDWGFIHSLLHYFFLTDLVCVELLINTPLLLQYPVDAVAGLAPVAHLPRGRPETATEDEGERAQLRIRYVVLIDS